MVTICDELLEERSVFPLHVIGAGSIGLLYASKIHQTYNSKRQQADSRTPVTLLMRAHHKPFLIDHYSRETNRQQRKWLAPVSVVTGKEVSKCNIPVEIIEEIDADASSIRTLLLCTKANDACTALASIWHRLDVSSERQTRIIILSNGALAIKDAILQRFSTAAADVDIIYGCTTHGVYRDNTDEGKYRLQYAGKGSTFCTEQGFTKVCQESGLNGFEMTSMSMSVMLWKKLAVNCVANPLTAIHNVKNGALSGLQHEGQGIEFTMTRILEEVSDIALREIESTCTGSDKSNGTMQAAREELSVESLQTFVDKVLLETASNVSSMLQDVRANRATEIQFLNGHVCRVAKEKYDVECPYNSAMVCSVEKLLAKNN